MDEVRGVCSTVLSLRKAQKLRVRLPLPEVTVATPGSSHLDPFVDLIKDEVNVKRVVTTDDVEAHGRFEVVVNARAAGPRLGKDVQKVIKAVKAGDWAQAEDGTVTAAGIALLPEEYTSRLVAAEPESTAALPGGNGLVVLDTTVTEELEAEAGPRTASANSRTRAATSAWRSPTASRCGSRFRPNAPNGPTATGI